MDDLAYLQPGFDPTTLRVPDLRRVLLLHDVHFPSTAKKAVLVDLFRMHITPRADSLREAAQVSDVSIPDIVDANVMNAISTTTPKATRRTPKKKKESIEADYIKTEEPHELKIENEDMPFSTENPFQTPKRSAKKSSNVRSERKPKIKEESPKPDKTPQVEKASPESEQPHRLSEFSSELFVNQDEYDEEEEMVRIGLELSGVNEPEPAYSFPLKIFIAWLFTVSWLVYLMWWRNEKIKVGYCIEPFEPAVQRTSLFEVFMPQCTPCPAHAVCYDGFVAECENDYVYVPSLLSLGGVLPVPPRCVPDTNKKQRVGILRDECVHILREKHAAVECARAANDTTISIYDLRAKLYGMKSARLSDDMFEQLWAEALNELLALDEVYAVEDEFGDRVGSTSTAEFPFTCVFKNDIAEFIKINKSRFIGLALATVLLAYAHAKYKSVSARRQTVKELVIQSLDIVKSQQKKSEADITGKMPRYVVVSQVKDMLKVDDRAIWGSVQRAVETNVNVRSRQMEVHGEIMRIWEWIGMTY